MVPIGESNAEDKPGLVAVLPIATNGAEMTWNLSQDGFQERLARGLIRYYQARSGEFVIRYIQEGTIRAIEAGEVVQDGTDEHGFPNWKFVAARRMTPMTTWKRSSHSASDYGTPMLTALLPGRPFPYPKSLYAVEDVLRFFIQDKPDACVLDCFAGSGTTAHAVMRLNRQDNGLRQALLVTNNEVSAEEQQVLRRSGLRQGDPEWEERGICDLITRPRLEAAITGRTHLGDPVVGDYRFVDEFPMAEGFEENAEFFTLTYESPVGVAHNRAFERIAPLLWLRAGGRGGRIDGVPSDGWAVVDAYGVLFDLDQAKAFCDAVAEAGAGMAFVVTDDDRRFQAVVRRLPDGVEPVRLYEAYLSNFRFASGE
jgi:adenine-specific DNA-methyltransferase